MPAYPSIILASQSPRRKTLLEWAEVSFEVIVKETAESFPDDLPIPEVPEHIALNKALAVQQYVQTAFHGVYKQSIILAADTVVVLDNRIIGKPADRAEAIQTLKALSGKTHQVITGVVLLKEDTRVSFADMTEVCFHEISDEDIEFYVDKYQPYDKAGAYAIQEWIGVAGIQKIHGDFYNVMGLPVSRVLQELKRFL
jgi:septum formation protein